MAVSFETAIKDYRGYNSSCLNGPRIDRCMIAVALLIFLIALELTGLTFVATFVPRTQWLETYQTKPKRFDQNGDPIASR